MAEKPARITAEVDLEGSSVDTGAGKLNPILQRIADRTRSAAGAEGGGRTPPRHDLDTAGGDQRRSTLTPSGNESCVLDP